MTTVKYICCSCGKTIQPERVEFLFEAGKTEFELTCTKHSQTRPVKGIYSGENGTSAIILCDKIYSDSVRSVFHQVEVEEKD